jgi:hypothetical protein
MLHDRHGRVIEAVDADAYALGVDHGDARCHTTAAGKSIKRHQRIRNATEQERFTNQVGYELNRGPKCADIRSLSFNENQDLDRARRNDFFLSATGTLVRTWLLNDRDLRTR